MRFVAAGPRWTTERAIIYLWVSTDEQAESRAGLDGQLDACRAHAARAGMELAGSVALAASMAEIPPTVANSSPNENGDMGTSIKR